MRTLIAGRKKFRRMPHRNFSNYNALFADKSEKSDKTDKLDNPENLNNTEKVTPINSNIISTNATFTTPNTTPNTTSNANSITNQNPPPISGITIQSIETDNTQEKENGLKWLFGAILFGILVGSLSAIKFDGQHLFSFYWLGGGFESFVEPTLMSFGEIFKSAFLQAFAILTITFLSGFSAISQPVSVLGLVFRGFSIGGSIAVTYAQNTQNGIFLTATLIIPYALLSGAILALGARESIRQSNLFARITFKGNSTESTEKGEKIDVKAYFLKFSVILTLLLLATLFQSVLQLLVIQ
jgi:hypothetical protein